MARTGRRVAYRRRNQNRFSMFLVSLVVVMIMVVVAARSAGLQQKIIQKNKDRQRLENQIVDEQKRAEELEEFAKEVNTKGYAEDMAREQGGLVHEDEILFKAQ